MACCPHFEQNSPVKGAPQFSQWVSSCSGDFDRRRRRKIPRRLGGSSAAAEMESARINCSASSVIEIPVEVEETVEILEWVARRGRRGGWQGASEAHPRSELQRRSDAARRPFRLAPVGLRRFWRWPALLAWPRSLRISALRSRLGQRQKSTATR